MPKNTLRMFNRGCQSWPKNYLTSSFLLCKIRLILQLKSDWSKHKKQVIITVTSRICFFGYPQSIFVFHTKRMLQMDPIWRLSTRCLKRMNPWRHVIVRVVRISFIKSYFKKVMSTVAENEWEGLFFCGK